MTKPDRESETAREDSDRPEVDLHSLRQIEIPEAALQRVRERVLETTSKTPSGQNRGRLLVLPALAIVVGITLFLSMGKPETATETQQIASPPAASMGKVDSPDTGASGIVGYSLASSRGDETTVQSVFELNSGDPDIVILWVMDNVEVINDET